MYVHTYIYIYICREAKPSLFVKALDAERLLGLFESHPDLLDQHNIAALIIRTRLGGMFSRNSNQEP